MRANCRRVSCLVVLLIAFVVAMRAAAADAQTKPAAPRRPAPSQPRQPQTRPPQPTPAAPAKAEPARLPAPPPQDLRFRTVYTNGDWKTDTVTYLKGERERYEFQDVVLLKQHDQKRTIQISKSANTYLVMPDGMAPPMVAGMPPAAAPKPPGIVMVATTIVDTGERKVLLGQQARHVKLMIDRQPAPNACDSTKQRIETDGWYIDSPPATVNRAAPDQQVMAPTAGCADQIQATSNGDPGVLGFPVAYTTTIIGADGKPVVSVMEVTELEQTTLDPALFEIPPGLTAAINLQELSKALSDANEVKLAQFDAAPAAATPPLPKAPGTIRIGVPEFTNKTSQVVNTRALRERLITSLTEAKLDAVPMATASPADLQKRASDLGYDFVVLGEVAELKASKPGGLGGLMKAASGVAAGRGGGQPKENTESSVAVKLIQADGKQRLSTTTKGKDGGGFDLQTSLGLAKFAGGMYLSMFAGPMAFARLNSMGAANLGGVGMLGNPALYQMQVGGLSTLGKGRGIDATAGAASFLMQQAMTMNSMGGLVGAPGQGPSYDESLGEAIQNAAKAVQKAVQK